MLEGPRRCHRSQAGAVWDAFGNVHPLVNHFSSHTALRRLVPWGVQRQVRLKSTLDPVRKKLVFHLKPVLLKTIPSLLVAQHPAVLSIHLVPVDNSSNCLMGKFPPTCYSNIFFPILINDVASKDYFFSGLANTISYLMAYWEYSWKKPW